MAFLKEEGAENYDWENDVVYRLEAYDPVEGGENGVSNEQAKALALRTRNLHNRVKELENVIAEMKIFFKSINYGNQD